MRNKTTEAIGVPVIKRGVANEPLPHLAYHLLKWGGSVSRSKWLVADVPQMVPYEIKSRADVSYATVAAGESLEVALPEVNREGSGLYFLRFHVMKGAKVESAAEMGARSEVFVVKGQ